MPEIGLGALLLEREYSGTAVYTRNLAEWLPRVAPDLRFRLFTRRVAPAIAGMSTEVVRTPFDRFDRGHGITARLDKFVWETVSLPLYAAARHDALVHSLYFAAPPLLGRGLVVTIHDLVPLILPDYHRSRQARLYSLFMANTARRADAIVTVSEHSAADIVRLLGVPASRVHVTYEAADTRFSVKRNQRDTADVLRRYALPSRFLLYIGGAERRKNVEVVIRAWSMVESEATRRDTRLVVIAHFPPPDALYPDIPGLVKELGLSNTVDIVPSVEEDDKPTIISAARALVFPSYYEGFGLPVVEAMTAGVPVIASAATSIPEVAGDAALLIDPHDVTAWSDTLRDVLNSDSLVEDLSSRGRLRAARFAWRATAEQTAGIYRDVLSR